MSRPPASVLHVLASLDDVASVRAVRVLAAGLTAAGWRVLVAVGPGARAADVFTAGARVIDVDLTPGGLWRSWQGAARLEALIADDDVDIVHAHGPTAAVVRRAVRRSTVPWVASPGDALEEAHREASRLVVPTVYAADRLRAGFGIAPERVHVVPPPVDLARLDPAAIAPPDVDALRRRWRLADAEATVVLPLPTGPTAGHIHLLRALKRLRRDDVVCAFPTDDEGADRHRKQIDLFARTAGIEAQVRFVAPPGDERLVLAAASVVCLPAEAPDAAAERAALEAQAMGVPVIVHAVGGLVDAIMPAATGWAVDVGDVEALAEALQLALAMPPAVRARSAARARAFIEEEFGEPRVVEATTDVYRAVLTAGLEPAGNRP